MIGQGWDTIEIKLGTNRKTNVRKITIYSCFGQVYVIMDIEEDVHDDVRSVTWTTSLDDFIQFVHAENAKI